MWVIVQGGLGNQMFQAAYAAALGERFDVTPRFVDLSARARMARRWELGCFGIEPTPVAAVRRECLVADARIAQLLSRWRLSGWPGALIESAGQSGPPTLYRAPRLIAGYWQGEHYFEGSAGAVRRLYSLATPDWCPDAPGADASRPTVAIHVRRGDYASDPTARNLHLVCDEAWYRRAWGLLRAELPQARALVFSDDPEWAQDRLALAGDVDYAAGAPGAPAWVDLARMSQCRHFVISNSSYSWWAAWLGRDPGKRVIAPRYWFRGRETAALGICPPSWTLL